jgi:hypothetical protein
MNSYQIISTGTPIIPYTIGIEANINVSQTLVNTITVPYTEASEEFINICQNVVQNAESAYKQLPEFSIQDTSSNGTYSLVNTGAFTYEITMTWTIENAVLTLQTSTTTDLQDIALESYLQLVSDNKVDEFKSWANWTNL